MAKAIAFATAHHRQTSPVGRRPLASGAEPSLFEPIRAGGARQCLAFSRPDHRPALYAPTKPKTLCPMGVLSIIETLPASISIRAETFRSSPFSRL